ncbi:MAG: integration host factor subunit alpha [Deltaproteobacteria bacterium]|nr:integration host factor subunit alpha [Deltaproteobacteria bacterium]MBW1792902.1 integration host factor subunit alpha [Deltaproteobacteria bacterium]MBW2331369.1 integration host factor subunit alpha [Deltaproteobacteria bacterium]
MPLTKAQIVNSIYNRLDISKNTSIEVVESLLEIIKRTLANGEDVLISGFGKFCVKDKGKRKVRNPQTGEDMMLESKRVVTFRCSRVLRNRINGEG